MDELVLIMMCVLTVINVLVFALSLKLYTEIVKQKILDPGKSEWQSYKASLKLPSSSPS